MSGLIDASFESRFLERLKYAASAHIAEELAMRDVTVELAVDMATRNLVATLRKAVLADKVLDYEADVPAHGTIRTDDLPRWVCVSLPRNWWRRILRRPARSEWCPVVGNVAISNAPAEIPVQGLAKVRAQYFRTFPEAPVVYPPGLGKAHDVIRVDVAHGWDPEVAW